MLLTILLLGALHGLQPDHAAAALAMARRGRTSVWRAAVRIAGGHALALGLAAAVLVHAPAKVGHHVERIADLAAAWSLVIIGAALLLQCWRGRYLVHAHRHTHGDEATHSHVHAHPAGSEHRASHHHLGTVGLGLVLGMGGARSLAVLLAAMSGAGSAVVTLALYSAGIAAGALAVSLLLDAGRREADRRSWTRWMDAGAGATAGVAGVMMLLR